MKGKKRCKILKEIRQAIADENGIEYVTTECKHKGDCAGTCPKCEQEVRYLEEELKKKQSLGKKIAVIGVAASVALSGAGCDDMLSQPTAGMPAGPEESYTDVAGASSSPSSTSSRPEFMGDIPMPTESDELGEFLPESEMEYDGDIAFPDELGGEPLVEDTVTESDETSEN